jgi:hypothetical protein
MKKNTPHKKAQGIKNLRSHSNLLTNVQQAWTQAEIERGLAPMQAKALRLIRLPNGMNDIEASEKYGLGNFIQRKCELQNLGFVLDEQDDTYTDNQGIEHRNMKRFRFIEWRADMIGCKDKAKAQADLDNANQLSLFDLEMD